jgi:flagellar hook-associated protein 3 FlgL
MLDVHLLRGCIMVMRVSENMKFNTMVDNLFKSQTGYNKLAIGMNRVLNLRESRASVKQYIRNINGCESRLTITESKLSAVGDLLVKAREVAVAQSTATASAETRSSEAGTVQQLIDEMLALANSKYDGKYLFSGAKTGEAPFSSSVSSAAEIGEAVKADGNVFDGTVEESGTYTGSVNKTYVVKIVTGGPLVNATYKVSDDGGKTWGDEKNDLVDGEPPITLGGDGVQLTFTSGEADLAAGDIFYVHAFAAGNYNGNGEELSVNIGEGTSFAYSISGEAAFTDKGAGNVSVFGILNELKTALGANDPDRIASCLDGLKDASYQISKNISRCGTRMNRLEIAKNNLADLDMDLIKLTSDIEDADITEIITRFAMKEIALKASYAAASKIGNLTILDFLR